MLLQLFHTYRFTFLALGFNPIPPHSPQPGSTRFTGCGFAACSALRFSRRKSATTSSPAKASVMTPLWSTPPSCGEKGQSPAVNPALGPRGRPVLLTSSSMITGRLGH